MKFVCAVFLFLLFHLPWAYSASDIPIDEIRLLKISESTQWQRLLHYKKGWRGYQSEVDGTGFFFSPEGKTNPLAELLASLKAISENNFVVGKFKLPPRCAFPERSRFLIETFKLSLEAGDCLMYQSFLKGLHNPQGVSLVFSSAYPNNPASMFGHTFLKIKSERDTDLLDHGINFAAAVPEDESPLAFFYFGVMGGFPGQWSILPYYVKVREYVNFESRDLWEYELNLTPEETRRLIGHLWELETNSYFKYYFFDENCSYQVLKALEAVKPEWTLDRHKMYMIPGESVKHALSQPDLLKDVKYRPSLYRKMWQQYSLLSSPEKTQFHALTNSKIPTQEISSRPVLEAAIHYFDFLKNEDPERFAKRLKPLQAEVLQRRATLGALSPEEEEHLVPILGDTRPDWGHDSFSIEPGVGHRDYENLGNETFGRLKIRTAYHDLLNNDRGYSPYAHLEFPFVEFQYNDRNRQFRIEEIGALATTSLTPVNALRTPVSYRMALAMKTDREFLDCDECRETVAEGGAGLTFASDNEKIWFYALILAKVEFGDQYMKGYDYGPGLEAGLLIQGSSKFKAQLQGRHFCLLNAYENCRLSSSITLGQTLSLGRNQELRNINKWTEPDSRLGSPSWESSLSFVQFFN